MARYLVVLAVCVLSAHAAQFYYKDGHRRVARSPYRPDGPPPPPPPPPGPPPPPPPPVFFRTNNWSGLARSADGSTQGVFSGAAAAADSLPTSGAAYSVASSGVTGSGSCCGKSGQAAGFGGQVSGNSGSYGVQSSQNGGSGFGQSNGGFSGGQHSSKNFKESHFSYQTGENQFGSHGGNRGNAGYSAAQSSAVAANGGAHDHDVESFGNQQELQQRTQNFNSGSQGFSGDQQQLQADSHLDEHGHGQHQVRFNSQAESRGDIGATQTQQSNNFGRSNGHSFEGSNSRGFASSSSQAGAYGGSGSQQHLETNRGDVHESKGQFNKPPPTGSYGAGSGQIQESASFGAAQSANGGYGASQQAGSNSGASNSGYGGSSGGKFGAEDLQTTLGGALNLASQGLQAAEQSGCSTCGKSNYALSNAKSHTGSAVALSIGG